jgi:hypothetical protein
VGGGHSRSWLRCRRSDEWAESIDGLAVAVADATLRELGMVQPPVVHMLVDGACPPYLGYLTCRPLRPGGDAAAAVASLGVLPSALGASRLVIAWEHADLCVALKTPGADSVEPGVVVVDADRFGHVLRWHPMRMRAGGISELGSPTVLPEWVTCGGVASAAPTPNTGSLAGNNIGIPVNVPSRLR